MVNKEQKYLNPKRGRDVDEKRRKYKPNFPALVVQELGGPYAIELPGHGKSRDRADPANDYSLIEL